MLPKIHTLDGFFLREIYLEIPFNLWLMYHEKTALLQKPERAVTSVMSSCVLDRTMVFTVLLFSSASENTINCYDPRDKGGRVLWKEMYVIWRTT